MKNISIKELALENNEHGELRGKDPRKMSIPELKEVGHVDRSLGKIIREKCRDCCAGIETEIRNCTVFSCPLWPLRMNSNPLRVKREMTEEQREVMLERLQKARKK